MWPTAAGVAAAAFAVYWLTLSRGILGGDAGELQFVPPILGLPHPTGYPLQVLLHFAWSQLPLGSVAYRLNLLDALLAAGAVGLVVALTAVCGAGRPAAALAGLSLAFGELWWSQAVRGDKYTLNGLFLALVLLLFARWRARPTCGRLALLALAYGLSLTHHRSMLLAAPALLVGLLLAGWRPRPWRDLTLPTLLVLAPLLLYAYVPWAGARGLPPGSWPVDTPSAFVEFLLDRGYTSQLRPDAAFGGRLAEEARVLLRSFGPLGAALGLLGLVVTLRRDWPLGTVLLLVFLPQAILGASYLLESNYQLPRHWVFFLPAFLVWSVWLGLGLDAIVRWIVRVVPGVTSLAPPPAPRAGAAIGSRPRRDSRSPAGAWRQRRVAVTTAVVALVLAVQAGTAWPRGAVLLVRAEAGAETLDAWRQDLQRSPLAERFGRLAFELAEPASAIVADWEQATVLWYLQRVEGQRPDLTIRYPIERLDETVEAARSIGQTVYITRTLPGVETRGVTTSVGPLLRVYSPPVGSNPQMPRSTLLAPTFQEAAALFDGGLALVNFAPHADSIRPGGVIPFTLYWQASVPLAEGYGVSVRLVGPDGAVLAAHDERHPALGTSPTNRWEPGQVVGDYRELPVGSRLRPGRYFIQVVPYHAATLAPLAVLAIPPFPENVSQPAEVGVRLPVEVAPRTLERPLDLLAALLVR